MSTAGPLPEPPQVPLSQIWLDRADAMYRVGRVDGVLTDAEDATISALIALFYLIREGRQDG